MRHMRLRTTRELILFFAVREIILMLFRNKQNCSCYGIDVWLSGIAAHCVVIYRAVSCSVGSYMEDQQLKEYQKAKGRPAWIIYDGCEYAEARDFTAEL